jgi:hypothetical protein
VRGAFEAEDVVILSLETIGGEACDVIHAARAQWPRGVRTTERLTA